jgi:hypothetical protein
MTTAIILALWMMVFSFYWWMDKQKRDKDLYEWKRSIETPPLNPPPDWPRRPSSYRYRQLVYGKTEKQLRDECFFCGGTHWLDDECTNCGAFMKK